MPKIAFPTGKVFEIKDTELYEDLLSLIDRKCNLRKDAKGQGVACGKSFIPRGKKCSKAKAKETPREALRRTTAKQKARQKLRAEIEVKPAKSKNKSKITHAEVFEILKNTMKENSKSGVKLVRESELISKISKTKNVTVNEAKSALENIYLSKSKNIPQIYRIPSSDNKDFLVDWVE